MTARTLLGAAAAIGLGAMALSGCETMSPEECAVADWSALGYQDGSRGQDRYQDRQKSCAKTGVAGNFDAYMRGRAQGLRAYCVPEAGFRRALEGDVYRGQCPADLAPIYSEAHADGRMAYEARSRLSGIENEIGRISRELDRIDRDLRDREAALREPGKSEAERSAIRDSIRKLDDDRRRANEDIIQAKRDVVFAEDEFARVRQSIGARWGAW